MKLMVGHQGYPYITTNRRIVGGSPIIKGTRIAVRIIAGYYQMGMSVDEILTTLQHLSPSQVHSALATISIISRRSTANWRSRLMSNSGKNRYSCTPERRPHRSQLNRLLDPTTHSVTLDTLTRAAHAVGRRVKLELV